MSQIAIIGAGITGVTTAYALQERGHDVTLFDRQRYAAMETSFANGGQLSACNAEVWNSWATVAKGLRWMLRRDAPLLLNPALSWHKYSWIAEFLAAIPRYRSNTVATTRLAIAARAHLLAMAARERIDFQHETRGILHVYRDRAGFDHATKVNALLTEGGLDRRPVTPEEIRAIEPTLAEPYHGGFFTASDSTGDIHLFTTGLAAACARRGAEFRHDCTVADLAVTPDGVRVTWREAEAATPRRQLFDGIVVCAGLASRRFAAMLGDRVNIYPVKGYSITVNLRDARARDAAPWVSLLDDQTKIVSSRLGADRFRVAGTAEFAGENRDIRADRIRPLLDWTRRLFPGLRTDDVVPWAGLRPMMPDMMPRVGAGRQAGVFYNTGHGHLGWTLSAATAQIVADTIELDPRTARRPIRAAGLRDLAATSVMARAYL